MAEIIGELRSHLTQGVREVPIEKFEDTGLG
jgi:hypothetical protein